MQRGFAGIYILTGILLLGVSGGVYLKLANSDFENCKKTPGSMILEINPPVCRIPDGKSVTEKDWRTFLSPFMKRFESIPQSETSVPPTPLSSASTSPIPKFTPQPTNIATSMPAPTIKITNKNIHLYPYYGADASVNINKLNIIGVFFVPKNITTQIKSDWPVNMDKVFTKIKSFYEKQFNNNIEITYQIMRQSIKGDLNIEEYYPFDFAKEVEDKNQNLLQTGTHNVWMIYLVRDSDMKLNLKGGSLGGLPTLNAATQYEFWLDNEAINSDTYGITGAAHEFGHALGIPHPWELPANIDNDKNFGNVPGDIMGYSSYKDLERNYIRDDVKKGMGL